MSPDAVNQPEPADALAATLKRTEIQRGPLSVPGREVVQVRTEIPAGVSSGWHTHPGEEVGYIIAGTVRMEIRDRPALTLNVGDGFLIPPRMPHNALDLGPDMGLMLSTYIVEVGQPIATVTDSLWERPGSAGHLTGRVHHERRLRPGRIHQGGPKRAGTPR